MSTMTLEGQQADIQRLVAKGYSLHASRHFILKFKDPGKARALLQKLVSTDMCTGADAESADIQAELGQRCPLNVGFTFRGLEKLELPVPYLRVFQEKARAFAQGAYPRAAAHLADTGASAAVGWDPRFWPDHAHVVVSLHADERGQLERCAQALRDVDCGGAGLAGWDQPLDAAHLSQKVGDRRVHFGFIDGIAKIGIRGLRQDEHARQIHEPGDFLLGYPNSAGFNAWLLIDPHGRRTPWLLTTADIRPDFYRNGSFAAFRVMEQRVAEFEAFVKRNAVRNAVTCEFIKAKLLGRWENGHVVQPGDTHIHQADPRSEDRDAFCFDKDRNGEGCPFGSHVRRMNGRDTHLAPARKRPLIRRGMPYGPEYKEDAPDHESRGLLGIFFCASLEDQFEHLLGQWADANPMGPPNRSTVKDPLIGNHEKPSAIFDIPLGGEKVCRIDGFEPFVRTRGTLYAFFPGKHALKFIAHRAW